MVDQIVKGSPSAKLVAILDVRSNPSRPIKNLLSSVTLVYLHWLSEQ